jgi:hypothetical protein
MFSLIVSTGMSTLTHSIKALKAIWRKTHSPRAPLKQATWSNYQTRQRKCSSWQKTSNAFSAAMIGASLTRTKTEDFR